jgi:hypothetical protein
MGGKMTDPARSFYEALRALEHKAVTTRKKSGLPSSRREAASIAGKPPYSTKLHGQRISAWLPSNPSKAQVPQASEAEKVWALVRVWSDWAFEQAQQRYWMDLIEAAQPTRVRKLTQDDPKTCGRTGAAPLQAEAHAHERPVGSFRLRGDGVGNGAAGRVAINLASARIAAGSAYLQQVRRIAPPDPPGLIGREAELAEMARFCLEADRGPYMRWQAQAWAGKSALLSKFVLCPPPEVADRVRIVSFFITARLAAQDTRDAFVQVLLEQLTDLTGQDLPGALPEAMREAYLLSLLAQAAGMCQSAGGRLVLVVDGLDEDRTVAKGPHGHSIAGLLPADPPAGMRVIVAGRPNPPVPDDVPDWHPLRDAAVIRVLPDSLHARDIQRLSRQELQGLLHGTPAEQGLLGIVTAARGGLSGKDLEELTGVPLWEVEEILHTVAGRTFTRRPSHWAPQTSPEIYLLGHEELQAAATSYFGQRLASYHDRLNVWADGYRARGWPTDTPEYLLSGYYRGLEDLGDLPRMIACAGDLARHDRMFDSSGSDSPALAEIRAAWEVLLTADEPDLVSIARLAPHYAWIAKRNASIPAALPAVIAKLGNWERAEAIAQSITHGDIQAEALACLSKTAAAAGDVRRAQVLASRTEALATTITDPHARSVATVAAAEAMAAAGNVERAEEIAKALANSYWRSIAIAAVVRAAATAGYQAGAKSAAHSIFNPFEDVKSQSIAAIEESNSMMTRSPSMRGGYKPYADRLGGSGHHERTFAELARATASVGDITRTRRLVDELEKISQDQTDSLALAIAAEALACIGHQPRSIELATRAEAVLIRNIFLDKVMILAQLARAAKSVGNDELAAQFADQAAAAAQQKPEPARTDGSYIEKLRLAHQATELTIAAEIAADLSETQLAKILVKKAETCARFVSAGSYDVRILAQLASAMGSVDSMRAAEMLEFAETVVHMQKEPESGPYDLSAVAQSAAALGDLERVERIASESGFPRGAAKILCAAAMAAAAADRYAMAKTLIAQAEVYIQRSEEPNNAQLLLILTRAVAKVEDFERTKIVFARCESAAGSIDNPDSRAYIFASLSELATELGDLERGRHLARDCERSARGIVEGSRRAELLAVSAQAAAVAGDVDYAYAIAVQLETESYNQRKALESTALAAAKAGSLDRAR